jgi:hypothetical protein
VTVGMFLTISQGRQARAVLFEPAPLHYVWLECWVAPHKRDGNFVKEFVRSALRSLRGTHHLHYFPMISSFRALETELNFSRHGTSRLFEGCVARQHRTNRAKPNALKTRISQSLPTLRVAKTLREGERIVSRVQKSFQVDGIVASAATRKLRWESTLR